MEHSPEDRAGGGFPEAGGLAEQLDLNHDPESGGLRDVGTCRKCGLLIERDAQGVWNHLAAAGEMDVEGAWIDRNPGSAGTPSEQAHDDDEHAERSNRPKTKKKS